jgi:hypothetical protein
LRDQEGDRKELKPMSASDLTMLRIGVGVVIGYVVSAFVIGGAAGYLYLRRPR